MYIIICNIYLKNNMNQKLITDFYKIIKLDNKNNKNNYKKKIYGHNSETDSWHCLECGIDMGINNPRQLCGKTRCIYLQIKLKL